MKTKQFLTLAILVVISSFIGGVVAERFSPRSSYAAGDLKTINATGFFLVDQSGKPRAALGLSPDDGGPRLDFLDKDGTVRGQIRLLNDEPGLAFFNKEKKVRIAIALTSDVPLISLADKDANLRILMQVPPVDAPGITIYDKKEKPVWNAQ